MSDRSLRPCVTHDTCACVCACVRVCVCVCVCVRVMHMCVCIGRGWDIVCVLCVEERGEEGRSHSSLASECQGESY